MFGALLQTHSQCAPGRTWSKRYSSTFIKQFSFPLRPQETIERHSRVTFEYRHEVYYQNSPYLRSASSDHVSDSCVDIRANGRGKARCQALTAAFRKSRSRSPTFLPLSTLNFHEVFCVVRWVFVSVNPSWTIRPPWIPEMSHRKIRPRLSNKVLQIRNASQHTLQMYLRLNHYAPMTRRSQLHIKCHPCMMLNCLRHHDMGPDELYWIISPARLTLECGI